MDIKYTKEMAKLSGLIAIYLPGADIDVGDIIEFPNGNNILGKPRPLGNFRKVTSLKNLGVSYIVPEFSNSPDSYVFSSSSSKMVKLGIQADLELGHENLPNANEKIGLEFSSEGSLYFSTTDCNTKELDDLFSLEKQINIKGKNRIWKNNFLVVSITIAKKAFIAQSQDKSSSIEFNGKLNAAQIKSLNIAVQKELQIKNQKGSIFIKDWSENVTVFMDVVRFEEKIFAAQESATRSALKNAEVILKKVDYKELLQD